MQCLMYYLLLEVDTSLVFSMLTWTQVFYHAWAELKQTTIGLLHGQRVKDCATYVMLILAEVTVISTMLDLELKFSCLKEHAMKIKNTVPSASDFEHSLFIKGPHISC
jgi:hypothetical protein